MIIKGWRKLKASDGNLDSWVANENKENETILALLTQGGNSIPRFKVVKKIPLTGKGETIYQKSFFTNKQARDAAVAYMKSHPNG